MKMIRAFLLLASALAAIHSHVRAAEASAELQDLSINGGLQDGKARLVIEAQLKGLPADKDKPLFATTLQHLLRVAPQTATHTFTLEIDVLQGVPAEFPFTLAGSGEIRSVTGNAWQDWSIRQETNGTRTLILRPRKTDKPAARFTATVVAEQRIAALGKPFAPLTLTPPQPALFHGHVKVEFPPELDVRSANPSGLVPIELQFLPESLRGETKPEAPEPLAFRFHGSAYALPLAVATADPEARRVVLRDFQLDGRLSDTTASFTLTATARVKHPQGAAVTLLSGNVALTDLEPPPAGRIRLDQGRFVLVFDQPGEFPVRLTFNAAVRQADGWNHLDFRVAPSALQPVVFRGLAADTRFQFAGAARPERSGAEFRSFLPPDGAVKLAWKEARPETEGKLFYSAEMLSQIRVSPGLMRQLALVDLKVMQGELNRVVLLLRGDGSVTRVQGTGVLAWNVEAVPGQTERRLVVQFNQPQKDQAALQVQMQTELGSFPQAMDAIQLRPEGATRFAGHFRVVNEGAVRLEVVQSSGLSQLSPEQFPETDATKAWFGAPGQQRFVFRFSSAEYALRIQADHILPELSVSQVLAYHLGETELVIDAELELDIREAPIRELFLRVPRGYALARLNAPGVSDYFAADNPAEPDAELRLVYGQPVAGRQVVQLRLERNAALGEPAWTLPRLEVVRAKSTRGHVGVSADPGFRLSPERTQGLTEIATAFFPRKVAGLQAAFRISEPAWQATLPVERLPQSIQADVLHLFSIGEGVGYGSSTVNYLISGAPIATFQLELSDEYFNVEFTGKDVRHWQKTTNGYTVQLHNPVAGPYTLLVTYERPFKSQGDTLAFTGARPLDAQSEQGHTVVISAYQFQVRPVNVSPGLLALETAEVPAEYRLLFDAPILAAYRYTSRPFNLQLALSPLAQADTLSLVVDRAALTTRISKDGEVLTDARYFVKHRGHPHFALTLPAGTELWSATVNGVTAVPVKDGAANLIPLPARADPNAVQVLELKLASRSNTPRRVTVAAPVLAAPVLLADWKLEADAGQRLVYRRGSLTPVGGVPEVSGFAGLARLFSGRHAESAWGRLIAALGLVGLALVAWRWAGREGTYRFSLRHVSGTLVGVAAIVVALLAFAMVAELAGRMGGVLPRGLSLLAPVQQSGSALTVEVANVRAEPTVWSLAWRAWPALLAVVVWLAGLITSRPWARRVAVVTGWTLAAWAALRWPNGAPAFIAVLLLFVLVHVVVPALRRLTQVPPRPAPPPSASPAGAVAALLAGALLALSFTSATAAPATGNVPASRPAPPREEPPVAESVVQEIRVENEFALATARIRWQATKGQLLTVLHEPAVLTRIQHPPDALKLVQAAAGGKRAYRLLAQQDGTFEIELQYQVHVARKDDESGFVLPTQPGLVNRLSLSLLNLDVDVAAPQAISVERDAGATNATRAELVLAPTAEAWIGWKPRSRDVRREKPVFYAELLQLFVPTAGVIEGLHQVHLRPAQGELAELIFDVPGGATITDVIDPAKAGPPADAKNPQAPGTSTSFINLWRFDPDTRKLRVSLNPPQSRPFTVLVRSQVATGPLPFEQSLGLLRVDNAAGQLGLAGVATGSEVQLDAVTAETFSPINLDDFPAAVVQALAGQVPGLTLRRAFRYTEATATLALKAAPVEPDVRLEAQQTLSLGEDRTVLAANVNATITRAGIFRLSFVLPAGLDVEALSGAALSHWTELPGAAGRVITLHLKGKTEGQQQFAITLAGPGTRAAAGAVVPRLVFREASKQTGQLLIVPEQGMRLQVRAREGVTQLDPQKAGVRQKGVLAFRLLQAQWQLTLDVEQVDPWVQVTGWQHATVGEAQVKVAANLQYQIENTGLKALRVRIPTNAENVRFRGEQVADFLPVPGAAADGLQTWEVKLHRRVLGKYLLQAAYQTPLAGQARETILRGVQAEAVNLQRGFVTLQAGGRVQVRVGTLPAALQPTEWQSIPRTLRQDLPATSAHYTFRLVEPAFQLPLALERHEAAKLLPARVNRITLTSVVSDEGVTLTQVRLELIPGDKRLLHFTLPPEARFWFAFVNQNGVWPWRDQDRILIPLEQQSRADQPMAVELFYSSRVGAPGRALELDLLGPKFDLPLENITWRVYLNEKWRLKDWAGSLQLQEDRTVTQPVALDVQTYLQREAGSKREQTREAEELLSMGNSLLERGDPAQARRAFQAAYGLSTHDDAFNEDARVQLHNLKLQQALVGLNVRQAVVTGEADGAAGKLGEARPSKGITYTQQEAKQIIDARTADENAALLRLAERLIQQQDAAVSSPTAIRANIPEQGRVLTFRRAVQVDTWADLRLGLEASAVRAASPGYKFLMLAGVFVALALLAWMGRRFGPEARSLPGATD